MVIGWKLKLFWLNCEKYEHLKLVLMPCLVFFLLGTLALFMIADLKCSD